MRSPSEAANSVWCLHVAHLHHGLRGTEADADLAFCRDLAVRLGLPFHETRVDTAAEAQANPAISKPGEPAKPSETIEEAARRLRYRWFRQLMAEGAVDAVATAHTLDDQAETVLAKFLRGAWTEGLSGIHPRLDIPDGPILRPLLATTRAEVEAYLPNWARLGARIQPTAISPSRATVSATNCCRCSKPGTRACASTWPRWPHWRATKKPGGRPSWPA